MKVALYARVSSKRQEKRETIASQVEALRRYAKQRGFTIAKDFVCLDDGFSGTILDRPGLDRVRDGAEAGQFDAVLVHSPDPLARKYAYLILVLEEFERLGVQVLFLEQPPAEDPHTTLLVQIQGAVAEYERAKLSERYRRGKLHRARQGEVFWAVPYGYRRVPRQDGIPAHVMIDKEEATLVEKIFKWHADEGLSMAEIARRLTKSGVPTPKGGERWGEPTLHVMLHNEAYIGTLYYNREQTVPLGPNEGRRRGTSPKTKRITRPKEEWIAASIPPIIDRETFERSKKRHAQHRFFSRRRLKEEHWLLRRLLRCGRCGRKHGCAADRKRKHIPPTYYYSCANRDYFPDVPQCRPNHVRADALDHLVWQEVRRHLLDPELLLRAQSLLKENQPLDQGFLQDQLQGAERRVKMAQAQRRHLLDAYQGGFANKEEFEERAEKLSERIAELEGELKGLQKEQKVFLSGKHFLSRIEAFTRTVKRQLDEMSFEQRQALVREVLEEVALDGDQVHLYFKIPLPRSPKERGDTAPPGRVSTEFCLHSDRDNGVVGRFSEVGRELGISATG
jgi:site-specific DNA recombinase